ncbi:MAG: hypothetical protein ACFBWO_02290 [Paracoccaceae bacterium]
MEPSLVSSAASVEPWFLDLLLSLSAPTALAVLAVLVIEWLGRVVVPAGRARARGGARGAADVKG